MESFIDGVTTRLKELKSTIIFLITEQVVVLVVFERTHSHANIRFFSFMLSNLRQTNRVHGNIT